MGEQLPRETLDRFTRAALFPLPDGSRKFDSYQRYSRGLRGPPTSRHEFGVRVGAYSDPTSPDRGVEERSVHIPIVCCDGTWNTPRQGAVTNVERLYNALADADRRGNPQVPFYAAG